MEPIKNQFQTSTATKQKIATKTLVTVSLILMGVGILAYGVGIIISRPQCCPPCGLSQKCVSTPVGNVCKPIIFPSITVLSPNGGEILNIGSTYSLQWKTTGDVTGKYIVAFLIDGPTTGDISGAVPVAVPAANSSYTWNIGHVVQGDVAVNIQPGKYKVKIILYDGLPCLGLCPPSAAQPKIIAQDTSDAAFSIVAPPCGVSITCEEGRQTVYVGTDAEGCPIYECVPVSSCGVSITCEEGRQTVYIGTDAEGCPIYECVPVSSTPSITVLLPNGGEKWVQRSTQLISFTSNFPSQPFTINLYRNDVFIQKIGGSMTNPSSNSPTSYEWKTPITLSIGSGYKIAVILDKYGKAGTDFSDAAFSIVK